MRLGICAGVEHWSEVAAAGADYVELPVAGVLAPEKPWDAVMPPLLGAAAASPVRAEAYNVLLPGGLKVVGPDADPARQARYLEEAFTRAAALGGAVAVFGSGGSRAVPASWPPPEARRQAVDFLRLAGTAAARRGLAVAIEPLCRRECNFINGVAEAVSLALEVSHPAVGVLSDLYHVTEEKQSYGETRDALPLLRHVHVAGLARRAPTPADHEYLRGFFAVLKAAGYDGRVSLECQWDDLSAQAAGAVAVVRGAWESA